MTFFDRAARWRRWLVLTSVIAWGCMEALALWRSRWLLARQTTTWGR